MGCYVMEDGFSGVPFRFPSVEEKLSAGVERTRSLIREKKTSGISESKNHDDRFATQCAPLFLSLSPSSCIFHGFDRAPKRIRNNERNKTFLRRKITTATPGSALRKGSVDSHENNLARTVVFCFSQKPNRKNGNTSAFAKHVSSVEANRSCECIFYFIFNA